MTGSPFVYAFSIHLNTNLFQFQVFAWIAFCVSVVWIYSLANEVVNLLQVQVYSTMMI